MCTEEFKFALSLFTACSRKAIRVLPLLIFAFVIGLEDAASQDGANATAVRTSSKADQPVNFVDAHVHLNDAAMQLGLMKDHGISRAVVFWGRNSDNESLLKAARDYPDKFIAFVSISPERKAYRDLWERDDPKLLTMLEDYLKTGAFKGIGEISVSHFPERGFPEADFNPLSSSMKGIMKLAEKYRVPVTIHCEVTRIREFSLLLNEFKNVQVIWAHGGYAPYFLAKRMLENHANLYYELSARTWLNHPRSPEYTIFKNATEVWPQWLDLVEANPDRFLLGTDASHHSLESEKRKANSVQSFLKQLSSKTRELVAEKNLLKLVR